MWKVAINRACKYPLVLARVQDLIVGVFEPKQWLPGAAGNFPLFPELPNNWGFVGPDCRPELKERYLHKRLPPGTIKKGAMGGGPIQRPRQLGIRHHPKDEHPGGQTRACSDTRIVIFVSSPRAVL